MNDTQIDALADEIIRSIKIWMFGFAVGVAFSVITTIVIPELIVYSTFNNTHSNLTNQ